MNENPTINYAFALKNYSQNGKGRSMKKFCEDEGYDYDKFLKYSRRGQKELSVLKEADERQRDAGSLFNLSWTEFRRTLSASSRYVCVSRTGWNLSKVMATSMTFSEWSRKCWDRAMVAMSSEYSIYLYRDKVDLRNGISGLSGIVRSEMRMNLTFNEI